MRTLLVRRFTPAVARLRHAARCALATCALLSVFGGPAAWAADGGPGNDARARSEERRRAWQQMPPEKRRELWQSLSPEQRELLMRRVPNDERRQMWQQMTPEQKGAMRQRFTEQRGQGGADGRSRLTPEERQKLRDEIRDAQKDWKKAPPQR